MSDTNSISQYICRPYAGHNVNVGMSFVIIIVCSMLVSKGEACTSRAINIIRPQGVQNSAIMRPNITFHTSNCSEEMYLGYCMHKGKCFAVTVGNSTLFNCECEDGFSGSRCEYKELDSSYLSSGIFLQTAGIALVVFLAILIVVFICFFFYIRYGKKREILYVYLE